ncbi:hypothetical protein PPGU19_036830 [Paraburkholderia sp. PGU19]|nr:hypothetical protein PPGU19_036830 [Paraburkholderia sp. PGU19]
MRGIEIARQQLVAYRGPRWLLQQFDRQSVRMAEFEQLCGDQRRGIAERDEPEAQVRLLELAGFVGEEV